MSGGVPLSYSTSSSAEEVEVRFEDQEKINEFGRLNNQLLELKADMEQLKTDNEKLEDSTAELLMSVGDKIMILIGEAFVEVSEDYANEFCNQKQQQIQDKLDSMKAEEASIKTRQEALKKELYGRFGDSINLEA